MAKRGCAAALDCGSHSSGSDRDSRATWRGRPPGDPTAPSQTALARGGRPKGRSPPEVAKQETPGERELQALGRRSVVPRDELRALACLKAAQPGAGEEIKGHHALSDTELLSVQRI